MHIEEIPVERIDEFWAIHIHYLVADGLVADDEDIQYFSGNEYRSIIQSYMESDIDRLHMIYFCLGQTRIGAAQYKTYLSEDGKCLILDFWLFPEFRRKGLGHACFQLLEAETRADGALFYEINSSKEDAIRFWTSLGFVNNGVDEYGMKLFMKV